MSSKSVGRRGLDDGDVEGRCDKNSMSPNGVALYSPGDNYVRITPDGFWRWFKARPGKVGSTQPKTVVRNGIDRRMQYGEENRRSCCRSVNTESQKCQKSREVEKPCEEALAWRQQ